MKMCPMGTYSCLPVHSRRGGRECQRILIVVLLFSCFIRSHSGLRSKGMDYGIGAGDPIFLEFKGSEFQMYTDVATAPGFTTIFVVDEQGWQRPALVASAKDCSSLDSSSRPTTLNTHITLRSMGYLPVLPYMFREHCSPPGEPSARAPGEGERLVIATARNVWVLPCGSMASSAQRGVWQLIVPHPEYHKIELNLPPAGLKVMYLPKAINVAQRYAHNYYHFMAEVIPRLLAVPKAILHDERVSILLPEASNAAFVDPMLALLGIDKARAVSAHTAAGTMVFASRVYVSTYSPFRWHSMPPRTPLRAAWDTVLSFFQASGGAGECPMPHLPGASGGQAVDVRALLGQGVSLVVSSERGGDVDAAEEAREVANWGEASKWVQAELSDAEEGSGRAEGGSWVVVRAEAGKMPLAMQACLFSSASALMGAHGSNIVNMAWMPKQPAVVGAGSSSNIAGKVIEILKPASVPGPRYANFWHMATALGLRHYAVVSAEGFRVTPEIASRMALYLSSS